MEEAGLKVIEYRLLDVTSTNISWKVYEDLIEDLHHIGIIYEVIGKGNIKKEPDGIDSNGCDWYEIAKLNKRILTPFAIFGLQLLGYKIDD